MTPERWQQVKTVLDEVLECSAPERDNVLELHCKGDDELRREVSSLLESESQVEDFIERPVFRIRAEDSVPMAEGQRVGAYRIVREVGRGGMGSVYLAQRDDRQFERRVALKLIRRGMDSEEILDRFRGERQILAHLDHENIAKLLDGGTTEDGRPYFVMEHVEGLPIDEYCDAHRLPIPRRLALFRQVCAAVHFAHQNLVVHRDLKPGNILVTAEGVPKLLDFGIAKLLHPGEEPFALTRADLRPMTPGYASPEQVKGGTISTASDVYSLGVLLYRLLTGRSPYRLASGDPLELSRAICEEVPARPSSLALKPDRVPQPDGSTLEVSAESLSQARGVQPAALRRELARDLDTIVLKALDKEASRRYESAGQLAEDLERQLQGLPVSAQKDSRAYRTRRFVKRNWLPVSIAAGLFLVSVGFGLVYFNLFNRADRERARAENERERAESEKSRAEAVLAFVGEVFDNADPTKARGDSITAREVLDEGVKIIDRNLSANPLVRADLQETMGSVYRNLALYEPATGLYENALSVRRTTGASDRHRLAQTLINLAGVWRDQGQTDKAEELVREALEIYRQGGWVDLDYAKGLNNLGEIAYRKNKFEEAEKLFSESLRIKRDQPGANEKDLARSLNNLGTIYSGTERFDQAEPMLKEALEIRRRLAAGRLDTDVATSVNNLASMLEDRGDYRGAEPLFREVLKMRRELYEDRHPRVARSLNNLGHVLDLLGRSAEAEPYCREAVSIAADPEWKDLFERAIFLRNFASVLVALKKGKEAEGKVQEALPVLRDSDRDRWRVADAETVLGSTLAARGRFQEAEPLLVSGYQALAKDKTGGAGRAPEARKRVHDFYVAWGKPERAAAYQ